MQGLGRRVSLPKRPKSGSSYLEMGSQQVLGLDSVDVGHRVREIPPTNPCLVISINMDQHITVQY